MIRSDTGPFGLIPEWVLDADVSDRAKVLYGVLGRYADRDGRAWPSRRKLAERLRCSVNSLDRARAELEGIGAVRIERRIDAAGDPTTNLYTVVRGIPTGGETGTPTAGEQNESHLEREPSSFAATPRNGHRNPIWDALTEVFGDATTETARSRRGKVCRSLLAAHATPDEILRRARSWPRHFDDATLTELALEKHWDVLGRKPLRVTR